jgi:hypothetical protein
VQQAVESKLVQALAEWTGRHVAWVAAQGVAAARTRASAVLGAEANAEATSDATATPLRALTHYLAHATQTGAQDAARLHNGHTDAEVELRSVRQFRATWSRLSADRQLTLALQQAPRNPGPINSHMLVLRSLALMRDISPDYLSRFVSYADTLLCLEAGERPMPVRNEGDAGTGKPAKKRVPVAPGTLKRSKPRQSL